MRAWLEGPMYRKVHRTIFFKNYVLRCSGTLGEWVLVTAAAGGVGIAAVQIAKGKQLCRILFVQLDDHLVPYHDSTWRKCNCGYRIPRENRRRQEIWWRGPYR